MKNFTRITGDLLMAKEDLILAHAVNAQGVMGAGIAKAIRQKFPTNFFQYKEACENSDITGKCVLGITSSNMIANLCTSRGFGSEVDSEESILKNTILAIQDMFDQLEKMYLPRKVICSNKFNSGIFNVPWEKTEAIIAKFMEKYTDYKWVIFEID